MTPVNPTIASIGANSSFASDGAFTEGASQTWLANSFVTTTGTGASVTLVAVAAAASAVTNKIIGICPSAAVGTAVAAPPAQLNGRLHTPFRVAGEEIAINITTATDGNIGANGVTWNGGGTGGVALAPGQQYGLHVTSTGIMTLNVANTTNLVFEIVGLPSTTLPTEPNGRIIVKVLPAVIKG